MIPGARNAAQARGNAEAAGLPATSPVVEAAVNGIYDELIRPEIHNRW